MDDASRYVRQFNLIGQDGQAALAGAKVLCVGVGGLGSLLSSYLVAAGIGTLGIIDGDTIELSNLTRQLSYSENDCSHSKASTQARFLRRLNSGCTINSYDYYISMDNAGKLIPEYDLVIDCSDNFKTRYLLSDNCSVIGLPLISAAVDGFNGQVMTFLGDVCYRCLFSGGQHDDKSCFNGDVIGPAVGIVASIQANEVIKFITKLARISSLIQIDSFNNRISKFSLMPDPACINNHSDQSFGSSKVQYLAIDQALNLSNRGQLTVIDIRSQNSLKQRKSLSISLGNIADVMLHLSLDQPVVVMCNYGLRSKLGALRLAALGYGQVYYTDLRE